MLSDGSPRPSLVDSYGRRISYLRLSVTDRCDLRCRYCMAEKMTFLPRSELLSIEELEQLCDIFIELGVRKIRLTGGEPLVRRNIIELVRHLGRRVGERFDEVTLTTNGTQLERMAGSLAEAGVRRINVSLDTRHPCRFRHITRRGNIDHVLSGIAEARDAGMRVRINMVALKGFNDDEFADMLAWCGAEGHDLCLIETMPLGEIEERRENQYLPLDAVFRDLQSRFDLIPSLHRTSGPARYWEVAQTGGRLGLITPLSHNFCAGCNRIRVTATGTIYGCLGHDQHVELRDIFRSEGRDAVEAEIRRLLAGKPERHDFQIGKTEPAVARHMSVTGG